MTPSRSRGLTAELSTTPLVDFLLAIVLFLLSIASPHQLCGDERKLLGAENAAAAIDAPFVVIGSNQILIDGLPAGEVRSTIEDGRVVVLEELAQVLRNKRELWRQLSPEQPFPGQVTLLVDPGVPALVVKSALRTATAAGYEGIGFAVRRRERSL